MRPSPIPREAGTCVSHSGAGGSGRAMVVRSVRDGARTAKEDRAYLGWVVDRACGVYRSKGKGSVLLRPGDGRVRARAGGRRGAEEAQRPRRRHGARRVVRRRVPAGLVPEIGRANGLRRRGRPRRARHGAGAAGVLRARRPRQLPRRRLVVPAHARLPCPSARMASQGEVSECLEHVDDPHLTTRRRCHSASSVLGGTPYTATRW